MTVTTKIAGLAALIAENTKTIDEYLRSHNLPSPSFDADGPATLLVPEAETEVIRARQQVVASTEELNKLMKGPTEMLFSTFYSLMGDLLELQFAQRFDIANLVPVKGSISYEDLAAVTGLDAVDIKRVLKRARLNHFFQEKDGKVAHTAMSRALRDNKAVADIAELFMEEGWPSFAKTVEALDRFKGRRHVPEETGFSIANDTPKGMYAFLAEHPARMDRFTRAMVGFAAREDFTPVLDGFDWTTVSTVVDVGGALGPCSIALAKAFPNLQCTVQDFEDVVAEGLSQLPAELKGRVLFDAHDMLLPQKYVGADVYVFRAIFHNWSDIRCVEILRQHIPALRPGAHIIIVDNIQDDLGSKPPWEEKSIRTIDLTMLAFFGAKERTFEDWIDLVKEASPKFKINYMGIPSTVIDLVWEG